MHSGANEVDGSNYRYDANGNLLSKANLYKSEVYEYTLTNRMKKSVVTDHINKTVHISYYDYDAFGRRTLVKDEGGKLIRTLYDGFGFDVIREQEAFADGYFTNTRDTGIAFGTVREGDGSRYRYIGDDYGAESSASSSGTLAGGYRLATSTRATSKTSLFAKGEALATTKLNASSSTERSYFGKDILGSVRSVTSDTGSASYHDYDAFGTPFGSDISDYAYAGKAYDPVTGMYNYGFRDYTPQVARFSTVDPIRDGANWFAYCEGDPVNKVDLWGLCASDKASAVKAENNMYQGTYPLEGTDISVTVAIVDQIKADKVDVFIISNDAATASDTIEFQPYAMAGSITETITTDKGSFTDEFYFNSSTGVGMTVTYPDGDSVESVVVDAVIVLPNQNNAVTELHMEVEF